MISVEQAPTMHALSSEALRGQVCVRTLMKEKYCFPQRDRPQTSNIRESIMVYWQLDVEQRLKMLKVRIGLCAYARKVRNIFKPGVPHLLPVARYEILQFWPQ